MKMLRHINDVGRDLAVPGRYLVETVPALKRLPAWFPGVWFKRHAQAAKVEVDKTLWLIYKMGKDQTVSILQPRALGD